MTADTLKAAGITNLDASPIVANTSGLPGAQFVTKHLADSVTPTTGGLADTTSTYRMVRLPANVYLKHVNIYVDSALDTGGGSAALAFDVGGYYSDSTVDGTLVANQGLVINNNIIADGYALKGSTSALAIEAGKWTELKRNQPLWKALGLSSDPGGQIDIVLTVETAANTAASAVMAVEVEIAFP
jgi:hypothetical protein